MSTQQETDLHFTNSYTPFRQKLGDMFRTPQSIFGTLAWYANYTVT
jgi:hypothetical protein